MRTGTLITSSAWSTVIFLNSVAAFSFGIQLVPRELPWAPLLPVFFLALTVSTTLVWWSYLKLDTAWPLYHLNPHPFACSTLVGLPPKCHLSTHRVSYPFYKCIGHCQSSSFGMDTYSVIMCIIILIINMYTKCSAVLADCVTQWPPSSFMPWLMSLLHFHSYIRPPLLQEWSLPRHPRHPLSPVLCHHHCIGFRRGKTCAPVPVPLPPCVQHALPWSTSLFQEEHIAMLQMCCM